MHPIYSCTQAMEGYRKNGLVHISQVCEQRIENVGDMVNVGDTVHVKVS